MYNVTRCRALCDMLRGIAARGDTFTTKGWSNCTLGWARRSEELQVLEYDPELSELNTFSYTTKFFGWSSDYLGGKCGRGLDLGWEYQLYCSANSYLSEDPAGIADWLERNMAYEAWDLAYAEKAEREAGTRETWEWVVDCVIPPAGAENAH